MKQIDIGTLGIDDSPHVQYWKLINDILTCNNDIIANQHYYNNINRRTIYKLSKKIEGSSHPRKS